MKKHIVAAKFTFILFLSSCFAGLGGATPPIKILGITPELPDDSNINVLITRGYNCDRRTIHLGDILLERFEYWCADGSKKILIDNTGIFYNSFSFGGYGKTSKEIASALREAFDLPPPIIGNLAGFDRETRFWIFDDGSALLINTKNVIAEGMSSLHYWSKKRLEVRSDIKASKKAFEEAQSPLTFE